MTIVGAGWGWDAAQICNFWRFFALARPFFAVFLTIQNTVCRHEIRRPTRDRLHPDELPDSKNFVGSVGTQALTA
jgi:hypothetical protein